MYKEYLIHSKIYFPSPEIGYIGLLPFIIRIIKSIHTCEQNDFKTVK